jgi:subtilisin family serine protease
MSSRIRKLASRVLALISLLALVALGANAKQNESDATKRSNHLYIVRLVQSPVVAYDGAMKGLKATKPKAGQKIDPNSPAVVDYAGYLRGKHDAALAAVGGRKVYSYVYSFNGFAAELSEGAVAALRANPDVVSVEKDALRQLETSSTPQFLGLPAGLWQQLGGPEHAGEDVIIGMVDSGVWPESPSFSDRDFTNPHDNRVVYHEIPGWHGKCTPGEAFPASLCGQKLIGAQYYAEGFGGTAEVKATYPYEYESARDTDGHGTHTSSTAGGNYGVPASALGSNLGAISGMAPRARIATYKTCWARAPEGGCFNSDNVAAIDQAVADGVDVINFSISGTSTNFLDAVEVSFLFAADAGVFVAASAGNTGPGAATVNHPSPWITTVAAGSHDRGYLATVTLGDGSSYSGASLTAGAGPAPVVYSANAGLAGANTTQVRLCFSGTLDPAKVAGKIVLCDRGSNARVDKSLAVQMAGGVGMILRNTSPNSLNADLHYVPSIHVDHVGGAAILAYVTGSASPTATLSAGTQVVAVAPDVAAFSSRGPVRASSDQLKPDVMAPGVDVLAAYSPADGGLDFNFLSGTSMSSPHIAGIGALLKHAHPTWTPMMIKSALMTTASQLRNDGSPIGGNPFGFGAGEVVPTSASDPGLVYNHGFNNWLGFLCGTGQLQASFCPALAIDPSDLNLASLTVGELAGVQTLRRSVRNVGVAGTYNVSVQAPAGIDVQVTPSSLSLGANQSATYQVRFTATSSAVLNAYAFGSLTWSDGTHRVRSPLTVRPVALAAPSSVSSNGGAVNLPVTFGYTGAFGATARGLVPAATTAGNVADDPTNDINKALASGVGITAHDIAVPAGTTYARFSLFDAFTDGNDDIDLYVFNSAGALVGSSGSGTSAEEVNLVNPAPGTYTVVVHGWQTDGPDANYTLFSWTLSAASAGNMAISAPATATTGGTGSVGVSFSSLTAGTKYLGAVDYNDGSSVIGSTIVRVDP